MEDYDFSIRNEIDSLGHTDHELGGLLSRYNIPHGPSQPPPPRMNAPAGDPYLANLIGQLQGAIGNTQRQPTRQLGGGFNLNIESDTLKWLLVLLFLLVVLWLVFTYTRSKPEPSLARNPLKRRLRQLEAQVKRMRSQKLKELPSDDIDLSDEE